MDAPVAAHSIWGCVLNEFGGNPMSPEVLEHSFRVSSASIQSSFQYSLVDCDISVFVTVNDAKPLEIAHLSDTPRRVHLDLVFKQGDHVAFHKRTVPSTCQAQYEVQLLGHLMDEHSACRLKIETLEEDLKERDGTIGELTREIEELKKEVKVLREEVVDAVLVKK